MTRIAAFGPQACEHPSVTRHPLALLATSGTREITTPAEATQKCPTNSANTRLTSILHAVAVQQCPRMYSTPLSRAAAKGHVGVVSLLLDRGAAVNLPGRGGLTPLHEAAGCGQVRVLADGGNEWRYHRSRAC